MNHNFYFSMREAELKREAEQRVAENWRLANPGHRRRRWRLPKLGPLFERVADQVRTLRSRPAEPQSECC